MGIAVTNGRGLQKLIAQKWMVFFLAGNVSVSGEFGCANNLKDIKVGSGEVNTETDIGISAMHVFGRSLGAFAAPIGRTDIIRAHIQWPWEPLRRLEARSQPYVGLG